MGLKWLVFLIGPIDLIVMWFGEDQRANVRKTQWRISRNLSVLKTCIEFIEIEKGGFIFMKCLYIT